MEKIKRLKKSIFHRAVLITFLSATTFVVPSIINAYLSLHYDWSFEVNQLKDIVYSLIIIFLNILIVKKWLSFDQVGLQRKGFIRSLLYSLIFVFLLRILDYFDTRPAYPNQILSKEFFFSVSNFIFFAFQEELMFRGIIFRVWEKWKGFLVALFVSSLLFGLEHLVSPALILGTVSTNQVLRTGFWGPIFGTIAYRTGNIWGLAISHFLYNASIKAAEPVNQLIEQRNSFVVLIAGLFIFLPIVIDKIEQRLFHWKTAVVWSRYLAAIFIIFFLFFGSLMATDDLGITKDENEFCPVIENEELKQCLKKAKEIKKDCHGVDLRLAEAKEKVAGNQKALEVLENNCLWVFNVFFHDFTGDSKEELAMITAEAGCASCHWQKIYIIKDYKVIFEKEAEDIWFSPAEDYHGFTIKYPLRRVGEAYCCPTEGMVESYQVWENDEYRYFHKFDERVEKY